MTVGRSGGYALLLLGAALLAGSCSPDTDPAGSPTSAPVTVGPLSVEAVTPLSGDALDVGYREPLTADGRSTTVLALDEAGAALLSSYRSDPENPLVLRSAALSIKAPGSTAPEVIPAPRRERPQQTTSGALNDRWAVWFEDPDTELGISAWVMYAYDRNAATTRKVLEAPKIDGQDPPSVPGFTGPTLAGDRVFWAQAEGPYDAASVSVYGCEIASCQPELFAAAAAYPVAVGDHLYVIARDPAAAPHDPWERFSIQKIDVPTETVTVVETIELRPEQSPRGLAASERALAWIVSGRPDVITVRDVTSGRTVSVESEVDGSFAYPVATDRFVAWAEGSGNSIANVGNYVYLLEKQQLYSVGNAAGLYGVLGAGAFLSWRDLAGDDSSRGDDVLVSIARIRE